MKQLTCEMCGSTDLMKQEGVFVCQTCGMKYSSEEAKKMMIEGTVDIQGTVKVDNSAFVEKYLSNARRAYCKEDWEEVEKYYNMVEQNAPTNMEAVFFSAYGKAMLALTDSDYFKREQKFNVLLKSISVINDCFEETNEDKEKVLYDIADAIRKMNTITYVFNPNLVSGVGSKNWQNGLLEKVTKGFVQELIEISAEHQEKYIFELIESFLPNKGKNSNGSKKSIASLVLSIVAMWISVVGICTFGIAGICAIVCSIIALVKSITHRSFIVLSAVALAVSLILAICSIYVASMMLLN